MYITAMFQFNFFYNLPVDEVVSADVGWTYQETMKLIELLTAESGLNSRKRVNVDTFRAVAQKLDSDKTAELCQEKFLKLYCRFENEWRLCQVKGDLST